MDIIDWEQLGISVKVIFSNGFIVHYKPFYYNKSDLLRLATRWLWVLTL